MTKLKEKMKKDDIRKAREFFENIVKIYGENYLYKAIYGELPTDEDSEARVRKMTTMYEAAKPLKDEIEKFIKKQK